MSTETHLDITVRFDHPIVVWMLQLGGWFPLPLSPVSIVLVDKNVLDAIETLAAHPDHPEFVAERWWLSSLNSERFYLNAVLCAHEGNARGTPSYLEFCALLTASYQRLAVGMPKARLIRHQEEGLAKLYENITATSIRHGKEITFLLQVSRLLSNRVSATLSRKVERQVIEAAQDNGLTLKSIVVIAVLSCLYEPQDGSEPMIGRRVIKPTSSYSEADAHNAISDIRALEMLALAVGIDGPPIGYCTRDKGLAALWAYLNVSNPVWNGNTFSATLVPGQQLFPRLNDMEFRKMLMRVGGHDA